MCYTEMSTETQEIQLERRLQGQRANCQCEMLELREVTELTHARHKASAEAYSNTFLCAVYV